MVSMEELLQDIAERVSRQMIPEKWTFAYESAGRTRVGTVDIRRVRDSSELDVAVNGDSREIFDIYGNTALDTVSEVLAWVAKHFPGARVSTWGAAAP